MVQRTAAAVSGIRSRETGAVLAAARELKSALRGWVYLPGEDGYDSQRAPLHAHLDPKPVLVAEACGPADVAAAVRTAHAHGLRLAVQATGHGTVVPSDGGLLLKTSPMTGVVVDPARRVARASAGARWSAVIEAASPFGLAPLSGSSAQVGVTGYTLGGGLSLLSRRYGLAADSLLRAEVVTADGRLLTASADRNADLFWVLRGGGGNFAVVTSLEFQLYPVTRVFGGAAYFPAARGADILASYRDYAAGQPDELAVTIVTMSKAPAATGLSGPVVAIRGLYAGDAAGGRRALQPLWQAAGPPLRDDFRPMPYRETTTIGGTAPRQFHLFAQLPDTLVTAIADLARPQSPVSAVEVRHWGGAIARLAPGAGPAGHRDISFSATVDGPAEAVEPLARRATGGSFLNFLSDPVKTHTAYSPANYARLRAIKRAYDPSNVLRFNHNIAPAAAPPAS